MRRPALRSAQSEASRRTVPIPRPRYSCSTQGPVVKWFSAPAPEFTTEAAMILHPCRTITQSRGSFEKPAPTPFAMVAAKALWISLHPVSMPKALIATFRTVLRSFPSARPRTNGEGALKPPVEILVRSHSNLSHASVGLRSSGYGESESFRQTHHTPPIRLAHKTTKAVSVNMSPAENLRSAFQVN